MTPGAIITLVKDVIILIAVACLIYLLVTYGKDLVKVKDMQALEQQLIHNGQVQAVWQKERTDAETQRDRDLGVLAGAIAAQRTPLYVLPARGPTSRGTVPGAAGQTCPRPAGDGGVDPGARIDLKPADPQPVDVRAAVNAFERKYETVIADCRAALGGWPVAP